jgi:para-aminobenzoate synthetase component 1
LHTRFVSTEIFLRELPLNADALVTALLRLDPSRRLSLLDGGAPTNTNAARFLIAGFDPFEIVEVRGRNLRITDARGNVSHVSAAETDALMLLDERLATYRQPAIVADTQRFPLVIPGACIATLSYELTQRLNATRAARTPEPFTVAADEPYAVFSFYNTLVIHDYVHGATYVTSGAGESDAERACSELLALADDVQAHTEVEHRVAASTCATLNFTQAEYFAAVLRIQEHIRRGDVYQANLTQQITCPLAHRDAPEAVYLRLRRAHPSAFGAFLRRESDTVISISPERFLRVWRDGQARRIEAAPIKGTRARGADASEDERLRRELECSEKDRAENIMIVDLMRNDLGRVCAYGSIQVTELCRIETHPTLFHLVSTVQGTLRDDATTGDLLRAAFPCGSITGAPKLRAMEILRDIEPCARGLSMGSIGYFAFDGAIDLNVAIRTMTIRERTRASTSAAASS